MATTKLGNTKSASRAINYAEKRAEVKSGYNCDIDYAKSNFKELRAVYDKEDGIQAHTIIQSFRPGEVTAEQANQIGQDLAKEVAKDHQVAIYTHTDKNHIHNHIVINSVDLETGKKYQSNKKQRDKVKEMNDQLCKQNGLEVTKRTGKVRYTFAEQEMLKKGKISWKDEIRRAIDISRKESFSLDEMKQQLENEFQIKTHLRGNKTITFEHPEGKKARGNKLGNAYERGVLENEFTRKAETKRAWPELERTVESNRKNERDRVAERTSLGENEPTDRANGRNIEYERENKSKPRRKTKQRDIELER